MSKTSKQLKNKGRANRGPFLALPRDVLLSDAWAALTAHEVKLLVDMGAALRGSNNGDLSCTWAAMHQRGWASRDTLARALAGLLSRGFITLTRQGGRRVCSLYAVTWLPVDECGGKLDVKPRPVPANTWRDWQPQKIVDTPTVSSKHAHRVNGHTEAPLLTRLPC
nr:D477 [uncultured bacterium]